jgi:hypothetical protein
MPLPGFPLQGFHFPGFLRFTISEVQLPKCLALCSRIPELPNSEILTPSMSKCWPSITFSTPSGFRISRSRNARFSRSLLLGFPGIQNTDVTFLSGISSKPQLCAPLLAFWDSRFRKSSATNVSPSTSR